MEKKKKKGTKKAYRERYFYQSPRVEQLIVPELRFAIEAQLRGRTLSPALLSPLACQRAEAHELFPLQQRCRNASSTQKGRKNKGISWESWGQLIPAVGASGSPELLTGAAGCTRRPPGPFRMGEPLSFLGHWRWWVPAGFSCGFAAVAVACCFGVIVMLQSSQATTAWVHITLCCNHPATSLPT